MKQSIILAAAVASVVIMTPTFAEEFGKAPESLDYPAQALPGKDLQVLDIQEFTQQTEGPKTSTSPTSKPLAKAKGKTKKNQFASNQITN